METMPDTFMARDDYIVKMRKLSAQLRIHPTRSFYPGQSYSPEVHILNATSAQSFSVSHHCADATCPPVIFETACTAPFAAGAARGPPLGDVIHVACLQATGKTTLGWMLS